MKQLFCNQNELSAKDFLKTRREFLQTMGMGMGMLGLAPLLAQADGLSPKSSHFPAKAKRVIHIFFGGGQSHIDTWDNKPELIKLDGSQLGSGMNGLACGSPFKFNKMGKSGIEVSEVFENIGKFIDDAVVIRSMNTDIPAHELATLIMNTGSARFVRPSLGAWVCYGLGGINQNMPAFVSLRPGGIPLGGTQNFGSAFLPGVYQGTSVNTTLNSVDKMIENIKSQYVSIEEQRKQLDLLQKLNTIHGQNLQKEADLEARLESFEVAFRMQSEATDAFDISKESKETREKFGDTAQGKQMLLARRLVERGVRFVQVFTGGWDTHDGLSRSLRSAANQVDKPIAALLADLKEKGLLDSTLIVMSGEFGRTPQRDGQGGKDGFGRGHWSQAFSSVLIGGGIKGGTVYGQTDDFGAKIVKNKVHVHDLHATILALLGFDHTQLVYNYNGREFRLTDVHGNVVKDIIA